MRAWMFESSAVAAGVVVGGRILAGIFCLVDAVTEVKTELVGDAVRRHR